ncbi:MAG: deoxyribose-phosphate aldolase [Lachnospiraceae bacterium]|nr:deoxyribose-phosphate aldolase [Lachnospiraceae bacterium]
MLLEKGYDAGYAKYCDHTVLRAYTTVEKVKEFCQEAIEYGAAAVCVNPVHVKLVHEQLQGTDVKTATVIGFPLGANKTVIKAMEAAEAVKDGADEVDMVINIGALRGKDEDFVYEDIKAVVDAAKKVNPDTKVKVIIETCYLTDEEKITACQLSKKAGADFVKTSTGMGNGGATVHDIELMKKAVGDGVKVKASGGVDNRERAYMFLSAGADRLGVSRVPQIVSDDTSIASAAATNQPPKF